jgi:hypothetical protein
MSDYSKLLESIDPTGEKNVTGTDTSIGNATVINEYAGVPNKTETDNKVEEKEEFESVYMPPKKVIVKRYKLKKL